MSADPKTPAAPAGLMADGPRMMGDLSQAFLEAGRETAAKLCSLEIIEASPPWPTRDDLTAAGQALHDRMLGDVKPFLLALLSGETARALDFLGGWAQLVQALCDDPAAVGTDSRRAMLGVFEYYVGLVTDWSMIQAASRR